MNNDKNGHGSYARLHLVGDKACGSNFPDAADEILRDYLSRFDPEDHKPEHYFKNHPDVAVIVCADSRLNTAHLFRADPGEDFMFKSVGAMVLPPNIDDPQFDAWLALQKKKGVRNFIFIGHRDCGAARNTIDFPTAPADRRLWTEDHHVSGLIYRSGLDTGRLVPEFLKATGGDATRAANTLARRMLLQSTENLFARAPWIEEGVMTTEPGKRINVLPMYKRIGEGTDQVGLEYYDFDARDFKTFDPKRGLMPTHMCERKDNCVGCSCADQAGKAGRDFAETRTQPMVFIARAPAQS